MRTIGIAICAYKGHIPHLKDLFDSIERQTRKPDQVVVSFSSSLPEDIPYLPEMYSFPFTILTHIEKKNAAQNRNIAGKALSTDIICFFDADDTMHPQRLEYIVHFFNMGNFKIVLHRCTIDPAHEFEFYSSYWCLPNVLYKCPWKSVAIHADIGTLSIAIGHMSVTADVFKTITFNESPEVCSKDDTIFCTDVIEAYPQGTMYCHNILSKYLPSRTMDTYRI